MKLIDDKLWYSVQQRLKETSRIEQRRRNLKHDYLLTSFLRCGVCGSICRGKTNPKIYMNLYYCGGTENRWRDSRVSECDKHRSKSVNVKKCDDLVWETLLDTIEKSTTLKQDFKDTMLGENLERVEDKEFEINNIILNKNREKKKVKIVLQPRKLSSDLDSKPRTKSMKRKREEIVSEKSFRDSVMSHSPGPHY